MEFKELKREDFRDKVLNCCDKYLNLFKDKKIAIGIYKNNKCFLFGNGILDSYMYDIGSITKTITAHLVLKYVDLKILDLNESVDKYLKLKKGNYPTIYELLTHSAGYYNLTPIEITLPNLLKYGYSKKNIYENINNKNIIKCLERRNKCFHNTKYGYSDFAYAILALIVESVSKRQFSIELNDFIKNDLKLNNTKIALNDNRYPLAIKNKKVLPYWKWNLDNPYLASGGGVSNIKDMLKYISLQIESEESFITDAHIVSKEVEVKDSIRICKGWHTYNNSKRLWHVGGVGTFRSSIIINRYDKIGVVVLGNSKGIKSANVHYLAKMIYSELKIKKIKI